jgi:hypothetical protein
MTLSLRRRSRESFCDPARNSQQTAEQQSADDQARKEADEKAVYPAKMPVFSASAQAYLQLPARFLTPSLAAAMLQRIMIFCDATWGFRCVSVGFLPVFGRFEANSKVFLPRPERRRIALA